MPATCDMPSVSQGWFLAAHRSFLQHTRAAIKTGLGHTTFFGALPTWPSYHESLGLCGWCPKNPWGSRLDS